MGALAQLGVFSLAIGGLSTTIAKAHVTKPLRDWCERRVKIIGEMLNCPYCVSHWISFLVVISAPISFGTDSHVVDFLAQLFAQVSMAALVSASITRLMLWHEAELEQARKEAAELRGILKDVLQENENLREGN
jgi:hypothetical protein